MRVYYWCKPCPYSVIVLSWLIWLPSDAQSDRYSPTTVP
jgi:hypothetical protein